MARKRGTAQDVSAASTSRGCLLVAFRSGPALALVEQCPVDEFRMGNRNYKDQGYGDWTGFYDWLRNSAEAIVGVRYWPFDETRFLINLVSAFPYVHVPRDNSHLEIYFSTGCRRDARKSDDQDFGNNRVFYSEEGGWAISFDTMSLSVSELASLRASDADWERFSKPRKTTTPAQVHSAGPAKLHKTAGTS